MKLKIWDSIDPPINEEGTLVYTWDGYSEYGNIHSLFKYLDANDDSIRKAYLSWIFDLGETKIFDKKIVEHFAFKDGFSFWWMTLFVEKSPWNQPSIMQALRIFALEKIITELNPTSIELTSSNKNLITVLKGLCQKKQIKISFSKPNIKEKVTVSSKSILKKTPLIFQSLFTIIRYFYERWPLKKVCNQSFITDTESIFICSYFYNLDASNLCNGNFYSKQWGILPDLFKKKGLSENWLQIYYPINEVPNVHKANEIINKFNQNPGKNGIHAFTDSFLSLSILFQVIVKYFFLLYRTAKLITVKNAFIPNGLEFSLWPLMKKDWYQTMIGPLAINNLVSFELFDVALSGIPPQKKGIYLYENLSWETAFIHSWKKHGHGKLIAVAHSTIRYWDLRYFYDPRVLNCDSKFKLPFPEIVALNGKVAVDTFLNAGFNKDKIIEVEALRYLNIGVKKSKQFNNEKTDSSLKILILGDYNFYSTISMLNMIVKSKASISNLLEFSIKPHPNYPVKPEDFPLLELSVVNDQLYKILPNYDIAISSNMTSASVDASLAGIPVIVLLDNTELNFSPLRSNPNVYFVIDEQEIESAIKNILKNDNKNLFINEFFFLDPNLPRWASILES
jgi:surface carbohydrate biosynthesis protein (TIGR04326 family)